MMNNQNEITTKQCSDSTKQHNANGFPIGFFETTAGSIPDFPERKPQAIYEQRLVLEPWDETVYLQASPANAERLNQAIDEIKNLAAPKL